MTTISTKQPPKIIHHPYRPSGYKEMTADASRNVRLGKRAGKLQALYADSAEGFRPSLKYVEDHTGIAKNLVSQIRKELVDHGLIAYDQETITIDWTRMQTFAALETPLPKHGKPTYAPVKKETYDWNRIPLYKTKEAKRLKYRNRPRKLEAWEEDFFGTLEQMTAAEYTEIIHGMGGEIPKERYITVYPDPAFSEENVCDTPTFETVEAF